MPSYPTQSYTSLEGRFKALTGLEHLQPADKSFLRELVNRRIRMGYERFPWPQFTVVGEPVNVVGRHIVTYGVDQATGPKLANNANIVFRVHAENPESTQVARELTFISQTDSSGYPCIRIIEPSFNQALVYVSYRKHIDDEVKAYGSTTGYYGDQEGDNPDVPWHLFDYVIQGSYADFLRGEGQTSKAFEEEKFAEGILIAEIDKVREQGRQYRHDVLQFRPPSQFSRHNVTTGGQPVGQSSQALGNEIQ